MSPALNGKLQRFERGNTVKIHKVRFLPGTDTCMRQSQVEAKNIPLCILLALITFEADLKSGDHMASMQCVHMEVLNTQQNNIEFLCGIVHTCITSSLRPVL